ncbi:uncharacterized protein ARMOST_06570 [Armillaria ostoyae]|uniref:Uncharacterized protein n=1 Tax=Armillaria ostoyae TaxID=47428 RepID=A0A284R3E9_ARMOS|nr:uncharacterized protein ARMOST_06570 [Armillaria ostoyae]
MSIQETSSLESLTEGIAKSSTMTKITVAILDIRVTHVADREAADLPNLPQASKTDIICTAIKVVHSRGHYFHPPTIMDVSIVSVRNTDVIVGPPHLRIRLVWFPTGRPINESFARVVDHLAVEVVEAYTYDFGKLKQTRDNLAAVLKASRAQWAVISGRHIFPATQADTAPVSRPIIPQKRPADAESLVERARMATDAGPGIASLTIISVPALQVGAADMNMQLRAMAQKVEEVARDAGVQNRTSMIKMQVVFKNN